MGLDHDVFLNCHYQSSAGLVDVSHNLGCILRGLGLCKPVILDWRLCGFLIQNQIYMTNFTFDIVKGSTSFISGACIYSGLKIKLVSVYNCNKALSPSLY